MHIFLHASSFLLIPPSSSYLLSSFYIMPHHSASLFLIFLLDAPFSISSFLLILPYFLHFASTYLILHHFSSYFHVLPHSTSSCFTFCLLNLSKMGKHIFVFYACILALLHQLLQCFIKTMHFGTFEFTQLVIAPSLGYFEKFLLRASIFNSRAHYNKRKMKYD